MNLGWLDVCLRVTDVSDSRRFYAHLGFEAVDGDEDQGWLVMVNGESRIGLFTLEYMGNVPFSLNFRGGDVESVATSLQKAGYSLEKPLKKSTEGVSATILDPDGHHVFLDAMHNEVKPIAPKQTVTDSD